MARKKTDWFMAALVIGTFLFIIYSAGLASTAGIGDLEYPIWGRIECAQTNEKQTSYVNGQGSGQSIWCGPGFSNEFTDKCQVAVKIDSTSAEGGTIIDPIVGLYVKYKECNADGTGCESKYTMKRFTVNEGGTWQSIGELSKDKKLFVEAGIEVGGLGVTRETPLPFTAKKDYYVWGLRIYEEGAIKEQREGTCRLGNREMAGVEQDTELQNPLLMSGGQGIQWINYVTKWVYGPPYNVFEHPSHGLVYCAATDIYSLKELTMKNGDTHTITPTHAIGSWLGKVNCCPNMPGCNNDFEFDGQTDSQCTSDIQCPNGGTWIAAGSNVVKRSYCDEETMTCQWETKSNVGCATTADCQGLNAGKVCDRRTWTCVPQDTPSRCGDNICAANENKDTCPSDCPNTGGGGTSDLEMWLMVVAGSLIVVGLIGLIARQMKR